MASSNSNNKKWTNPNDVMKIHRIKLKRHSSVALSRSNSASEIRVLRRNSLSDISIKNVNSPDRLCSSKSDCTLTQNGQKRKNPFSCGASSSKRRPFLDSESAMTILNSEVKDSNNTSLTSVKIDLDLDLVNEVESNKLLHVLHHESEILEKTFQVGKQCDPPAEIPAAVQAMETKSSDTAEQQHTTTYVDIIKPQDKCVEAISCPPVDWSLKTKLRIVAQCITNKFDKVPGMEARNVESFIHHRLAESPDWKELDIYQKLKRCCMHFSYPQMPWISTFPRISSDYKTRSPSILSASEDVIRTLHKDWVNAFTSVYQQLRSGICPYFYTCTHQFNVLFRCLRTPDGASISALLSPSTRGLREMLRKEGVEFRMPNLREQKSNTSREENETMSQDKLDFSLNNPSDTLDIKSDVQDKENVSCQEKNVDSDDDINDDEGASRWLEGMGLDKKDFPSLEPVKVKIQREGYREIDNRPQSMVYVEGADVHTFFNFLLNYSSSIAQSGPQHGIPPTILSPVVFVGATLVQNSFKHSLVRSDTSGSHGTLSHVFEVAGPVLPHHSLNIASMLRESPDITKAVLSYSTHMPSVALNTQAVNQEEKDKLTVGIRKLFVDYSMANPGLLGNVKERLVQPPVLGNCEAVKEMTILPEGFLWTC
ncbi:protein downstream neighbor of Son-like [Biomphalaria glabrata]|uniref:Protein downstream neighbor of Son-like n=1 Tax=Biomphalaria glabrata TaxID=6526 RepID=A0A2C9LC79_BIOGL|nr:protein downstream neighbor of Son-like [Biomphalaria glabrata]